MPDFYDILNVKRSDSDKEIKSAYRKLARKYHPDVNPGDKAAEERFKEISEAYDILSDKKKRAQYDRVGHQAWKAGFKEGQVPPGGPGGFSWDFGGGNPHTHSNGGIDLEDLFGGFFGGRRRRPAGPQRGADSLSRLAIPMMDAVGGGERRITVTNQADGKRDSLTVNIPKGVREGQKIRLAGKGEPGARGGSRGDLLIEIVYEPDPRFTREGADLTTEIGLPFSQAVLGGEVSVPTLEGNVDMKVPSGTQGGQRLRLKDKGLPRQGGGRGNLYARVRIIVPKSMDEEGIKLIERLRRYE